MVPSFLADLFDGALFFGLVRDLLVEFLFVGFTITMLLSLSSGRELMITLKKGK